jgi:NAD-dependent deacetylase
LVRRFYDTRREFMVPIRPNAGHDALVRLQAAWGPDRVVLVTQNVDGLLQRAGSLLDLPVTVIEMHGALRRVRCERRASHPRVELDGALDPDATCVACGAGMRPDVVWFGEMPEHMDQIANALARCVMFLSVGTSGVVYPAAGFVRVAMEAGARCVEINPEPTAGAFHEAVVEGAEVALPRIVDAWLA